MFDDCFSAMAKLEADTDRQIQELFGDRDEDDMTDEEVDIIFSRLPHETKLVGLAVLRAGLPVTPKTFTERVTDAGRIHAAGLGIKLD